MDGRFQLIRVNISRSVFVGSHGDTFCCCSVSGVSDSAALWTVARQASLSFTVSQTLLSLLSVEPVPDGVSVSDAGIAVGGLCCCVSASWSVCLFSFSGVSVATCMAILHVGGAQQVRTGSTSSKEEDYESDAATIVQKCVSPASGGGEP